MNSMTVLGNSRGIPLKERITVTIDKELLEWVDKKVNEKTFANRSHGLEFLIKRKMEDEHE